MANKRITACVSLANRRRKHDPFIKLGGKWQRVQGFDACAKRQLIKFGNIVIYIKVSD